MKDLTLYKINPQTPVLVLPPGSNTWRNHKTTKLLGFTVRQELDNSSFDIDNTYKVVNFNRWIVAVKKEEIKLFLEA